MEKHTFYRIVTELEPNARYSEALNAKTVIEGLKKTRNVKAANSELAEEKVHLGRLDDYEEIESGHELPHGTFRNIYELIMADLTAEPDKSPAAIIRAVGHDLVLEDVKKLAEQLLDRKARIPGIGQAKARTLLDGTIILIGLIDCYPDSLG